MKELEFHRSIQEKLKEKFTQQQEYLKTRAKRNAGSGGSDHKHHKYSSRSEGGQFQHVDMKKKRADSDEYLPEIRSAKKKELIKN